MNPSNSRDEWPSWAIARSPHGAHSRSRMRPFPSGGREPSSRPAAAKPGSTGPISTATAFRVLLVEDNPADAFLIRTLLSESHEITVRLVHAGRLPEASTLL